MNEPPSNRASYPEVIGRYQILSVLGTGGEGTVYLARDTASDGQVALKVGRRDLPPEQRQRFLANGRLLAGLQHPNLCPVVDVGESEGWPYVAMAHVAGTSLGAVIREGPPPISQVVRIVMALAQALDYAHGKGILHLDLKPSNIQIDAAGQPVVIDFGLAAARDEFAEDGTLGMVPGTPAFMSPEQVRGDRAVIGPPADVYSLGMVLYQALTGRLPFEGKSANVLYHAVYTLPEPPSSHRPEVSPQLDAVCLKALAKQPEARYASMAEFGAALSTCLTDAATAQLLAAQVQRPEPPACAAPRHPPDDSRPTARRLPGKFHRQDRARAATVARRAALLGPRAARPLLADTHCSQQ